MDINGAKDELISFCMDHKDHWQDQGVPGFGYRHILDMNDRWSDSMSDTKKCRWLGWMQAVACVSLPGHFDLETMKQMNKRHAD